jgi:hypothetical protein
MDQSPPDEPSLSTAAGQVSGRYPPCGGATSAGRRAGPHAPTTEREDVARRSAWLPGLRSASDTRERVL